MPEVVYDSLPESLLQFLQGEKLVFVSTIDHETGAPNTTAISWMLAKDAQNIRFAMDPRSRVIANLRKDPRIQVTVPGAGSCFGISGIANIGDDVMNGVSLKMVMVEIQLQEVRDVMFYGGKLSVEPQYEKTYDPKLAKKFDAEIYTALQTD
ncbi:pyridoxamine 5'-phosphate oxidase family protein [Fodinisporobacter ferrooxydans]|uniref:Pyridoxamine 5'-phosphate oxidase family protein n=1 Tax=Fodinisporobacter ferrooxydans TaxID=2901836 RepID=A0ABY4CIR9_9BACL|nr:pyridoxamine 5'-phosphate oxidase family protein [Alicyclobacillaceae bacterium MYW30-H2]